MENERTWDKSEDKILKKYYPILGAKVNQFLPNRSYDSIDHRARRIGVKYGLFELGEEAYVDIETTNFNADFAYMLTYSFKVKGQAVHFNGQITREEILSGDFDKRLCKDFVQDLLRFKRVYGYYSTKFDIPFVRTRCLVHGVEFPPFGLIQHQDIYYLVKSKMKMSRNRLDNATHLLGIDGKTHLDPRIWQLAQIGDKASLKYIMEHNEADVDILERLHNQIAKFAGIQRRSI